MPAHAGVVNPNGLRQLPVGFFGRGFLDQFFRPVVHAAAFSISFHAPSSMPGFIATAESCRILRIIDNYVITYEITIRRGARPEELRPGLVQQFQRLKLGDRFFIAVDFRFDDAPIGFLPAF